MYPADYIKMLFCFQIIMKTIKLRKFTFSQYQVTDVERHIHRFKEN